MTRFVSIEKAIDVLKAGRMIILMDDEKRENEGDLVIAADFATPEAINFMARFGRGLICLPMAQEMIERLRLPMMASTNRSPFGTGFTVSIEAAEGVSTGISAADRAKTIATAIHPQARPDDLITPGHIFPLRAKAKGVLERQGQTEGSVDLARLAGLTPAAVICEIINEDGTMSRQDDLHAFSIAHDIPMVTVNDVREYRIRHENLVAVEAHVSLPTKEYGRFDMTVFSNQLDTHEHFALVKPPTHPHDVPLVRIHSECITGDVLGSCKCDCGAQLHASLAAISKEGGVLVYLRQEGRGIGLANKLKAYALQEKGLDTVDANLELGFEADQRDYGVAYQILNYLGLDTLRLMTNNPDKLRRLAAYGIQITERVALQSHPTEDNVDYLRTKQQKMGHLFTFDEESPLETR